MDEANKLLLQQAEGEITEKKSRFIAILTPIATEAEAEATIASIRKQYWDAKHHCYAWIVKTESGDHVRCSDDGEPGGTAGRPMLEVLQHEGLFNVVAVVTRYFGGTLLGTGGLVRAYQQSVKAALDNADIGIQEDGIQVKITLDYGDLATVQHYMQSAPIRQEDAVYEDKVHLVIRTKRVDWEEVREDMIRITCARIIWDEPEECILIDRMKHRQE